MTKKTTKWVNYIDRLETGPDAGLIIYVGKGNLDRVKNPQRNEKHTNVRNKYGIKREIVAEFDDEKSAYDNEKILVDQHHTYYKDPQASYYACNLHPGGNSPRSCYSFTPEETRLKISENTKLGLSQMTDEQWQERSEKISANLKGWTDRKSDEDVDAWKQAISSSKTGIKQDPEVVERRSAKLRGRKCSDEEIEKRVTARKAGKGFGTMTGKVQSPEARRRISEAIKRRHSETPGFNKSQV